MPRVAPVATEEEPPNATAFSAFVVAKLPIVTLFIEALPDSVLLPKDRLFLPNDFACVPIATEFRALSPTLESKPIAMLLAAPPPTLALSPKATDRIDPPLIRLLLPIAVPLLDNTAELKPIPTELSPTTVVLLPIATSPAP